LAVRDLEAAVSTYEQAFGIQIGHRERSESEGITAATFQVGEVEIELMEPVSEDSPVGRFLARRGEGVHHLAYTVEDVATALSRARSAGLETLDQEPRPGLAGTRVGFIHPHSLNGVLTELVEDG
jgi:methylmalonyl-CoA epimerase